MGILKTFALTLVVADVEVVVGSTIMVVMGTYTMYEFIPVFVLKDCGEKDESSGIMTEGREAENVAYKIPADVVAVVGEYKVSEFAATIAALYEFGLSADGMLDAMVGSEFVNVETKLWKSLVGNGATIGGEGPLPENGTPATIDVDGPLVGVVIICVEEITGALAILVPNTSEVVELDDTLMDSLGT